MCGISYTEQMRHFHLWNLKVQFQHRSAKELIMFIKTLPTTKMHSLLDWRKSVPIAMQSDIQGVATWHVEIGVPGRKKIYLLSTYSMP